MSIAASSCPHQIVFLSERHNPVAKVLGVWGADDARYTKNRARSALEKLGWRPVECRDQWLVPGFDSAEAAAFHVAEIVRTLNEYGQNVPAEEDMFYPMLSTKKGEEDE